MSRTYLTLLFMMIIIGCCCCDSSFIGSAAAPTNRFIGRTKNNNHKTTTTTTKTMILPLHRHESTNHNRSIKRTADDWRRRLHQSTPLNARMRLYDDLLTNGYYTTRLWIGTPPQKFALIVDTGSTVTYVPCSDCEQCGKHQDPRFQPELSATYNAVKCNPGCNCDEEMKICTYERRYAEMSSSSGVLGEDIISFGNESELTPQRGVFGCENLETGDLYSQRADGIMGLGRGRLSIVDQLVDKNVIGDSFSLCYGGMDVGGGAMVLGKILPPRDMVFSHSDPFRSPYYNIELKELHVAGKPLKLSSKIFDEKHGTVLDSGTTYAYFPEKAFTAFKEAIKKETHSLKQIPGPDPSYNDICFAGAGRDVSQLSKIFPEVDMVFGAGQKLTLTPENYLFRHTKVNGAYCLGVFQNVDSTTLLGGIVVRNTLVTYDREDDKIGFWKTNCSELWKNQQSPGTPPPVSPTDSKDSDEDITKQYPGTPPPTLPPTASASNVLPDTYRVGFITFDVEIALNNSTVRPNFTELAEFIAHELEVDDSQVRVMNSTSEGNEFLVRLGIFPARSNDYISNITALNIILRLKEHQMQLPERYGSYKLVEWNVQPQKKQSWWQQYFLAVVAGTAITLVICLSTIGILLVWRRRRESNTYKPVDADGLVIAEQELQPLQT